MPNYHDAGCYCLPCRALRAQERVGPRGYERLTRIPTIEKPEKKKRGRPSKKVDSEGS